MTGTKWGVTWIGLGTAALILAALACTAPGAQQPDTAATVAAVYATITAQANLSPQAATLAPLQSTPTQSLPATPTPPEARGPLTTIHTCGGKITVDARAGDWPDSATSVAIDQIVFDPNQEWAGASDLGGTARLCWTDESLYLLFDVVDDVHFQTQSGDNSYLGDEVELMFDSDLRGDFYKTSWDEDDHQLSLNPGDFKGLKPAVYRYQPVTGSVNAAKIAVKDLSDAGNYRLEASIGWGALGGQPVNNQNYGLCLALNDADHPDKPPAEDTLLSSCAGLAVSNPTTWGSATFVAP